MFVNLMTSWICFAWVLLWTVKKWPGLIYVFEAVFCVVSSSVRQPTNLYFEVKKTKQLIQALTILTHALEWTFKCVPDCWRTCCCMPPASHEIRPILFEACQCEVRRWYGVPNRTLFFFFFIFTEGHISIILMHLHPFQNAYLYFKLVSLTHCINLVLKFL